MFFFNASAILEIFYETTTGWLLFGYIPAAIRPGGMREAIKSGHRALGATVGAVWWINRPSYKTLPPINEADIPLPTGPRPCRRPL